MNFPSSRSSTSRLCRQLPSSARRIARTRKTFDPCSYISRSRSALGNARLTSLDRVNSQRHSCDSRCHCRSYFSFGAFVAHKHQTHRHCLVGSWRTESFCVVNCANAYWWMTPSRWTMVRRELSLNGVMMVVECQIREMTTKGGRLISGLGRLGRSGWWFSSLPLHRESQAMRRAAEEKYKKLAWIYRKSADNEPLQLKSAGFLLLLLLLLVRFPEFVGIVLPLHSHGRLTLILRWSLRRRTRRGLFRAFRQLFRAPEVRKWGN